MSDNELIKTFVINQQQINMDVAEGIARIEQAQKDAIHRLLGGDGQIGAIPYLVQTIEKNKTVNDDEIVKIKARIGHLEVWRTSIKVWIGAAVSIVSAEATAIGFWFSHILGKVHVQ